MFTHYEATKMQKLGWFEGLGVSQVVGNIAIR